MVYRVQDSMNYHVENVLHADGMDIGAVPSRVAGLTKAEKDVEFDNGKGALHRSPNQHRWRQVVSDMGVPSWIDLDA